MSFYERKWWKESVGYQIYLKSFKDTNNDSFGDLKGITEKLDYLKNLGINLLWICPFYRSPMVDNGYDVSDFLSVDETFGTIEDFKELVKEADKREIRIIIDLVLNQTSNQHPWFIEGKKDKYSPYRDYYIWSKGKTIKDQTIEPTNWASFFGGSAWEYDKETNEYYMKIFAKEMPDLNWKNSKVRKEMHEVAKFWLKLGASGFRVDAAAHLGRAKNLKDSKLKTNDKYKKDWKKFSNLKSTFKYLKEFKEEVFSFGDYLTIGEVGGGATPKEAIKYSGFKKGSLNMVFNFDHCFSNNVLTIKKKKEEVVTDLTNLKKVFNKWQTKTYKKAWNPIYWLNHDHPRLLSHYGNVNEPFLSGSMLAVMLYFKGGTPFVYQGEELGMSNYPFQKIEDFNDVSLKGHYEEEKNNKNFNIEDFIYKEGLKTRDNARGVMSWNNQLYAGFSEVKPWFFQDVFFQTRNAQLSINDENSLYYFYKNIFNLRKDEKYLKTLIYGSYKQILKKDNDVYCYIRKEDKEILVVVNFFNQEKDIKIKDYNIKEVLISNYKKEYKTLENLKLKPYEAAVFLVERV